MVDSDYDRYKVQTAHLKETVLRLFPDVFRPNLDAKHIKKYGASIGIRKNMIYEKIGKPKHHVVLNYADYELGILFAVTTVVEYLEEKNIDLSD